MDAYILDFDANRYRHFDVADLADDDRLEPFDGSPMVAGWQPVKVKMTKPNRKRPQGDLSAIGLPEVLSARAADALGDLLLGRCELLPLDYPDGEFYALNVTRISDALDEQHSEFDYYPSGRVMDIERYEFFPERLAGETIFKLPHDRGSYSYVTETFKRRVQETGLTGFVFPRRVWSGPDPASDPAPPSAGRG